MMMCSLPSALRYPQYPGVAAADTSVLDLVVMADGAADGLKSGDDRVQRQMWRVLGRERLVVEGLG